MTGRICESHAVLSNKLLGPAMIGSLAAMIASDPEFFDAKPDAGGYREHRFRYDTEGRLMLPEAAMERLNITREELDARFAAARRVCAHASHRFAYYGGETWRQIQGQRGPERATSSPTSPSSPTCTRAPSAFLLPCSQ